MSGVCSFTLRKVRAQGYGYCGILLKAQCAEHSCHTKSSLEASGLS